MYQNMRQRQIINCISFATESFFVRGIQNTFVLTCSGGRIEQRMKSNRMCALVYVHHKALECSRASIPELEVSPRPPACLLCCDRALPPVRRLAVRSPAVSDNKV